MNRSSGQKIKNDSSDQPRSSSSQYESEYKSSYAKPSSVGPPPNAYKNCSSPYANTITPMTKTSVRRPSNTKPLTPYYPAPLASVSRDREQFRSLTASSAQTLDKISKMEKILKKSDILTAKQQSMLKLKKTPTSAGGNLPNMYPTNRYRNAGATPRFHDNPAKLRGGDNTWTSNFCKKDDDIAKVNIKESVEGETESLRERKGRVNAQSSPRQSPTQCQSNLNGQGDNSINSSILNKPSSRRETQDRMTGLKKSANKKRVRFSENVTTHLVPYEDRGSNEWRQNLIEMNMVSNMQRQGFNLGYPSLGMGLGVGLSRNAQSGIWPHCGASTSKNCDYTNLNRPGTNNRAGFIDEMNTMRGTWQSEFNAQFDKGIGLGNPNPKRSQGNTKTFFDYPNCYRR